jgi:phosphoglycolate phosphatase
LKCDSDDRYKYFSPYVDTPIPETIQHLHSQTHFLGIITSNTQEVVNPFLTTHSLDRCFINVVGGGTIFGKGRLLAKYVKRYGFSPDYTVYVGDEVRDIQAARFAGLRSAAVTWGFNSREALALAKPDWLVDEPQELTAIAAALSHQENKH